MEAPSQGSHPSASKFRSWRRGHTFRKFQAALVRLGIELDPTRASASISMPRYSIVTLGRCPPARKLMLPLVYQGGNHLERC